MGRGSARTRWTLNFVLLVSGTPGAGLPTLRRQALARRIMDFSQTDQRERGGLEGPMQCRRERALDFVAWSEFDFPPHTILTSANEGLRAPLTRRHRVSSR